MTWWLTSCHLSDEQIFPDWQSKIACGSDFRTSRCFVQRDQNKKPAHASGLLIGFCGLSGCRGRAWTCDKPDDETDHWQDQNQQ